MSIQIKEIIASDTISGLVEKLNYNFDQILLNGGGPRGPQGGSGTKGNIGDRGMRGNIWIVQDDEPALNNDDYIPGDKLVLNTGEIKTVVETIVGQEVVKTWESTDVNIKGETGATGDNGIVNYIAQGANDKKIVHFNKYEYVDGASTSTSLSTVLIGGASDDTGIDLEPQYIVPDDLLSSTSIKNTSLLIHSNNANSKAIVFTGHSTDYTTYTKVLSNAAYIRLNDNDSIQISAGTEGRSSILLDKSNKSYINIGEADLTISHISAINIKRNNETIIKIASETAESDRIPTSASAESGSLLLNANKIGVLAKELQLNSVNNFIRMGVAPAYEGIQLEAQESDINIYAYDRTKNKGKLHMLGSNIILRGIDIDNTNTLRYISTMEFIKNYDSDRRNQILLKSNEIYLSTSRYKKVDDNNDGHDAYIHIKNGSYDEAHKGIELVTTRGSLNLSNTAVNGRIALRNGGIPDNNAIELNMTTGNNNILIAGAIADKPGILLDNKNDNVQLTGKTIWNDGVSFINANTLPNLKSVHIRKNTQANSPNLILSTPNNTYPLSRLLYGYRGTGSMGHLNTQESITINPGSVKLSYGHGGQHYNDTHGHNQGFIIRTLTNLQIDPGFKIIEDSTGRTTLNIDKNGITSGGDLTISGDGQFGGNCNVGYSAGTPARLTAVNTSMPGVLYSCRFKSTSTPTSTEIAQSHIWGPFADITRGNIVGEYSDVQVWGQGQGPTGANYKIAVFKKNTLNPADKDIYNGISFKIYRLVNQVWKPIDVTKDFTVQVSVSKNAVGDVYLADYYINTEKNTLEFYTYTFLNDTKLELRVSNGVPFTVTLIGPIVKLNEDGEVLWDFRPPNN